MVGKNYAWNPPSPGSSSGTPQWAYSEPAVFSDMVQVGGKSRVQNDPKTTCIYFLSFGASSPSGGRHVVTLALEPAFLLKLHGSLDKALRADGQIT